MDDYEYDRYIGAEVLVGVPGEGSRQATVKRCVRNDNGTVVGTQHRNPLIYTREYELDYNNVTHDQYFANVIADSIYSQINSKGRQFLLLEDIFYHRKYGTALEVANGYTVGHNGNRTPKKTTCGWQLCIKNERGLHRMDIIE